MAFISKTYLDTLYQPLDSDLTTWAGITPAAGVGTFLSTPNSANLLAAVTDETGSGALVFGTAPTITSPIFTGVASPTYAAGKLTYDTDNESLTFYNNDSNIGLQIGQEEWIRVKNVTGSTIANGKAVYINGANSGLPTIALAKADSSSTILCAGLTTESIANNAIGYVTCIGVVHGLDTSGFSAGATVFVDASTAGSLTSTAPTSPNYRYRVGIVAVSDATVGSIHVAPSTAALGNGTANQVFGMNSAGTAQEVKSILGTTNRLTMTNAANSITADISATFEALLGKVASPLSQFASTTSLQLKNTISDETGSGLLVFNDTPTLIAPSLGTPSSGNLLNCTGYQLNAVNAAGGNKSIDNGNNKITWQWNSLTSNNGYNILSSSTAGTTGGNNTLLYVSTLGANVTSAVTTVGLYAENTHNGTTSVNYGIMATASAGDTNYGIQATGAGGAYGTAAGASIYALGRMRLDGQLDITGSTSGIVSIKGLAAAGTWSWTLPTSAGTANYTMITDGAGVSSWALNTGGWTVLKVAGSNYTNATTSLTDITGLVSATLTAATLYEFEAVLYVNSSSTAGMQVAVQQTGTGSGQIGVWSGTATSGACKRYKNRFYRFTNNISKSSKNYIWYSYYLYWFYNEI